MVVIVIALYFILRGMPIDKKILFLTLEQYLGLKKVVETRSNKFVFVIFLLNDSQTVLF